MNAMKIDMNGLYDPTDAGLLDAYGPVLIDARQKLADLLTALKDRVASIRADGTLSPIGQQKAVVKASADAGAAIEAVKASKMPMLNRDLAAAQAAVNVPNAKGRASVLQVPDILYEMKQAEIRSVLRSKSRMDAQATLMAATDAVAGIDIILAYAADPMAAASASSDDAGVVQQAKLQWLRHQYPEEVAQVEVCENAIAHLNAITQIATTAATGTSGAAKAVLPGA